VNGVMGAASGAIRIAIGRAPLDAWVVAPVSARISLFAHFVNEMPVQAPAGATRGGKRTPFPGACG
jgi:hypothetical protein